MYAQKSNEYTVSTTIEFVKNTDVIVQNENYWFYMTYVIPEIIKNRSDIESVLLIGSASPEGDYDRNVVLSNKRANKIYSYISKFVPKNKIIKDNNYSLFLNKTGLTEIDYQKLRATYIEVRFTNKSIVDTVYVTNEKINTVTDTVFVKNLNKEERLVLSLSNDVVSDLLINPNIGLELYFAKMSLFIDGMFNYRKDLNVWHSGLRKYFNSNYNKVFIGLYGRFGLFDLNDVYGDLYGGGLEIGYKFDLGHHWKIYPIIRVGYDRLNYIGPSGNGSISFGEYVPGQIDYVKNVETTTSNINSVSNYTADYFGPTYIGITIQRNFYIKRK